MWAFAAQLLAVMLFCLTIFVASTAIGLAVWVVAMRIGRFIPDEAVEGILREGWRFSCAPVSKG